METIVDGTSTGVQAAAPLLPLQTYLGTHLGSWVTSSAYNASRAEIPRTYARQHCMFYVCRLREERNNNIHTVRKFFFCVLLVNSANSVGEGALFSLSTVRLRLSLLRQVDERTRNCHATYEATFGIHVRDTRARTRRQGYARPPHENFKEAIT